MGGICSGGTSVDKPIKSRKESGRTRSRYDSDLDKPPVNAITAHLPDIAPKKKQLLLFGIGEAGKTTILRQLILANGKKLKAQRESQGWMAFSNLLEGLSLAIRYGTDTLKIDFSKYEHEVKLILNEKDVLRKRDQNNNRKKYYIKKDVANAIKNFAETDEFKKCMEHRNDLQISDGFDFFLEQLINFYPEWGGVSHIVSDMDLLHTRVRTTGKISEDFVQDNIEFQLIDLGGQKVERRRYEGFRHVDAIIYVVSMSDYDQKLFEDRTAFRLNEAVSLWKKIVNSKDFDDTYFMLILNKLDLLQMKFKKRGVPITKEQCLEAKKRPPLPSEDDESCSKVIEWFEDLFRDQVEDVQRNEGKFRAYVTSALDRSSIRRVLQEIPSFLQHRLIFSEE